ncbi:MAG: aminoacyl-tRNA hydrolase [Candidatus Omnitrophica bacterium]|nr:aminoacyl-tRNA hydrolase [Candidatus Omnitrophota bacterium]
MKLVVGLGNPGSEYEQTKHNVGFWVVDALARQLAVELMKKKFDALWTQIRNGEQNFLLIKPMTYMNRSGFAVANFMRFFKIAHADLLVIVDDVHLPVGSLRLRPAGSAGGHNGLRSIIEQVGGDQFARLRCGIGRAERAADLAGYVLSGFCGATERAHAQAMVQRARDAALVWIAEGSGAVMNRYNGMTIEQNDETRPRSRAKEERTDGE